MFGYSGRLTGGKHELELPRHVDHEELPQRDGEEETEEGADQGEGKNATKVLLRCFEQVQVVHGRQSGDEEATQTTSTDGRSLDDTVLLRAEETAQNRGLFGHGLGYRLDDGEAEDGAEHTGGEREARLETCARA